MSRCSTPIDVYIYTVCAENCQMGSSPWLFPPVENNMQMVISIKAEDGQNDYLDRDRRTIPKTWKDGQNFTL